MKIGIEAIPVHLAVNAAALLSGLQSMNEAVHSVLQSTKTGMDAECRQWPSPPLRSVTAMKALAGLWNKTLLRSGG